MRKSLSLIVVIALALTMSQCFKYEKELEALKKIGYSILENKGEITEAIRESEDLLEKVVFGGGFDLETIISNKDIYEKYLNDIGQTNENADYSILNCSVGNEKNFWKFAAWPVGVIGKNVKSQETIMLENLPDGCWTHIQVTFALLGANSYELVINPSGPKSNNCSEIYTIGTTRQIHAPIQLSKSRKITVNNANPEQMVAIHNFGLHFYRTCDSLAHVLPDLYMTLALFLGGFGTNPNIPVFGSKPTSWQNRLNPQFIQAGNNYQWKPRKDVFIDLDETQVHSGDFLIITRMDGLDQIIQWGSGSIAGHSVVLLEFDGEMYAIESQDGWYWPKHGIQRNPWKQWKKWAKNAGFNVAILPLSDEQRAKFNVEAAAQFFKKLEGYPYGYHNFLFGWIDKPQENIPPITQLDFLYILFAALERVYAAPIVSIMGEALNKRLNTTNLNLYQIYNVLYDRGMTLDQLFAIPEQDGWIYSDGPSYVCSAFVAGVYKAGGLFDGKTIQATEFTPRDVYQMDFYNTKPSLPQKCKDTDPDLPYCQIMGKFKMDITQDGWSTKKPYNDMFQTCPSMPPLYNRPNDC